MRIYNQPSQASRTTFRSLGLACLCALPLLAGCSHSARGGLDLPAIAAVEMASTARCEKGKPMTPLLAGLRAAYDAFVAPTAPDATLEKVRALRALTDAACAPTLASLHAVPAQKLGEPPN